MGHDREPGRSLSTPPSPHGGERWHRRAAMAVRQLALADQTALTARPTFDYTGRCVEAWCSGLTCSPVKAEIAGSNPVASVPSAEHSLAAEPLNLAGQGAFGLPVRVLLPDFRRHRPARRPPRPGYARPGLVRPSRRRPAAHASVRRVDGGALL